MKRLLVSAAFSLVALTRGSIAGCQAPAGVVLHDALRQHAADTTNGGGDILPSLRSPRFQPFAPVASVLVPGAGQLMLGDDRAIGYVAVEAIGWWLYAKDLRERVSDEREFKTLARRVARAHFTTGSPDALPDAPWSYYELMRDHKESGQYSLSTSGEIVPETDPSTFNGNRWILAQGTNSTRAAALEQYKREAVRPEFEWSWTQHQLEYDIFSGMTAKRNDADNAATLHLLLIGANHVLSMIDAFATFRLRVEPAPGGGASLGASVRW